MKFLKRLLGIILGVLLIGIGVFIFWMPRYHVVPILMYHHVDYSQHVESLQSANVVEPDRFEWHMKYLKDHHFHVISVDDLVQGLKGKKRLPPKAVAITLDDGYEDNYTHAYPILKKYGYPAMIFLPSDLMNTTGFLTWDQIKEMVANNIDMGSHTRTHVYLPDTIIGGKAWDEIFMSKKILEDHLAVPIKYFCYPSGGFSEEIQVMVAQAGYEAAFTTNRGASRFNKDLFALKRLRLNTEDQLYSLWAKLSGYYNLFRRARRPN